MREPFGYCVLQALYCECLVSKYIYLHTNKTPFVAKNTLHGFPPEGEMWLLNVVLTAHVKWLLVTLLEGNHYLVVTGHML